MWVRGIVRATVQTISIFFKTLNKGNDGDVSAQHAHCSWFVNDRVDYDRPLHTKNTRVFSTPDCSPSSVVTWYIRRTVVPQ